MNILFITSSPSLYGANRSLLNMIEGLSSMGHTATVIVQGPCAFSEELFKNNINFIHIPFYNEIGSGLMGFLKGFIKFLLNWKLVIQNFNNIKSMNFDLIHSNSSVTFFGAYLSFLLKIPHFWHIREFLWKDYQIKYSFGNEYFKFWLNKALACICISQSIFEVRLTGVYKPIKKVIYNGIIYKKDLLAKDVLGKRFLNHDRKFIIGIIGTIVPGKNQLEAVKAFNILKDEFPNFELQIIGGGAAEYINEIEQYISDNNLENRVFLKGIIYNILDYYENLNLLLMCSKNEGLGRVTVEAMSKGVPVIGYNGGGTVEIINDKVDGLLYSGNEIELANKIKQIYLNKDQSLKMSIQALSTVESKFLVENYSLELSEFYKSVLI